MDVFFEMLLETSLYGSIVILAVLLLRRLLGRAPRRMVCLLWLLALVRLVMPFTIESSISLQPRLEPMEITQMAPMPAEDPVAEADASAQSPDIPLLPVEITEPVGVPTPDPVTFWDVAPVIWLAGVCGMTFGSLASYIRLRRRVREAYPAADGFLECGGIDTAFVLGFFRPNIYLPAHLTGQMRTYIVAHEKTHISRLDHWYKLAGYLVLSLHWFNPLVWLAYHLLCRDMETACDEQVVKDMDLEQRKAYSHALLACAGRNRHVAACPVAFGETSIKQRILSVLNYKKPSFWVSLMAVAAVVFVVVFLMTAPGGGEPDLSFLNYENAISLLADQERIQMIHYGDGEDPSESTIGLGEAEGYAVAAFLDGASWRERWLEPYDQSFPGSVEFVIGEDYRIILYDRNFARVQYGNTERFYRTGREDYEKALTLLLPGAESITDKALEQWCVQALEGLKNLEECYSDVWIHYDTGNVVNMQTWEAKGNWLRETSVNEKPQTAYMKIDGKYFTRNSRETGSGQWAGGIAIPEEGEYLPWVRTFDWTKASLRVERTGTQAEIDILSDREGPFQLVTCILTGPFRAYGQNVHAGIITCVFDREGNLAMVELVAVEDSSVLAGTITEEGILAHSELMQVSTILRPADLSAIQDAYGEIPEAEKVKPSPGDDSLTACQKALEELMSDSKMYLSESYAYVRGEQLERSGVVNYFRYGDDWVRTAYMGETQEIRTYVYCGGDYYFGLQSGEKERVWGQQDGKAAPVDLTWLHELSWDSQQITFLSAETVEGLNCITFQVYGTPASLGWEDVKEYKVTFVLDVKGALQNASMRCARDGVQYASTITIQSMSSMDILTIIRETYQEASDRAENTMQ